MLQVRLLRWFVTSITCRQPRLTNFFFYVHRFFFHMLFNYLSIYY